MTPGEDLALGIGEDDGGDAQPRDHRSPFGLQATAIPPQDGADDLGFVRQVGRALGQIRKLPIHLMLGHGHGFVDLLVLLLLEVARKHQEGRPGNREPQQDQGAKANPLDLFSDLHDRNLGCVGAAWVKMKR